METYKYEITYSDGKKEIIHSNTEWSDERLQEYKEIQQDVKDSASK